MPFLVNKPIAGTLSPGLSPPFFGMSPWTLGEHGHGRFDDFFEEGVAEARHLQSSRLAAALSALVFPEGWPGSDRCALGVSALRALWLFAAPGRPNQTQHGSRYGLHQGHDAHTAIYALGRSCTIGRADSNAA